MMRVKMEMPMLMLQVDVDDVDGSTMDNPGL
jgi:hypothetical protein